MTQLALQPEIGRESVLSLPEAYSELRQARNYYFKLLRSATANIAPTESKPTYTPAGLPDEVHESYRACRLSVQQVLNAIKSSVGAEIYLRAMSSSRFSYYGIGDQLTRSNELETRQYCSDSLPRHRIEGKYFVLDALGSQNAFLNSAPNLQEAVREAALQIGQGLGNVVGINGEPVYERGFVVPLSTIEQISFV